MRFIKSLAIGDSVLVRARVTVVVGPFGTCGDGVGVRERDDEECSWDCEEGIVSREVETKKRLHCG